MSARTAAQHTPAELTFVSCDHVTGIVTYAAPSKHEAGRTNHVALDTTNGATHCDCRGAECGRQCWHQDLIAAAWSLSPAMQQVRWLTDEQLVRFGKKARSMTASYLTRAGRVLPADALSLVAARSEWRGRVARAATAALTHDMAPTISAAYAAYLAQMQAVALAQALTAPLAA